MPPRDRFVSAAAVLVRILFVLNLVFAAVFALAFIAIWPAASTLTAHLLVKYGAAFAAGTAVHTIASLLLLGLGASAAAHVILRGLLALIGLVRRGDPFVPDAARQVERIGWALLALQLLDLLSGVATWQLRAIGAAVLDWQPSLTGWLAVLVAFVLARVFRLGAGMRDELQGTI